MKQLPAQATQSKASRGKGMAMYGTEPAGHFYGNAGLGSVPHSKGKAQQSIAKRRTAKA